MLRSTTRSAILLSTCFAALLALCDAAAAQVCNNVTGSVIYKPRLFVGQLNRPPGGHTLTFSGTAAMPHDPPIDPLSNGFRFVVTDAQDEVVIDSTVPPGTYAPPLVKNGWRDNGRGGFFYKNNTGTTQNDGVFAVTVNELRGEPGTFQFRVRAKGGSYPLVQADLPLKVTVILDPPTAATTGQCTEAQYVDECRFNKALSTLRCKPAV